MQLFNKTGNNNEPLEELLKEPVIEMHVRKYEDILDKIIHNLDCPQKIFDKLIQYGRMHYNFGAEQKYAHVSISNDFLQKNHVLETLAIHPRLFHSQYYKYFRPWKKEEASAAYA